MYSRQDKQEYLVVLKQEEHELSSLPAMMFENKLCAHDMYAKLAALWVKNNLSNIFVMYALDSAHEKFDV